MCSSPDAVRMSCDGRGVCPGFGRKAKVNRSLGTLRRRWESNIKMDITEIGRDGSW
jgi:hypothetical protein